jgi:hypothetical protein
VPQRTGQHLRAEPLAADRLGETPRLTETTA